MCRIVGIQYDFRLIFLKIGVHPCHRKQEIVKIRLAWYKRMDKFILERIQKSWKVNSAVEVDLEVIIQIARLS